jgi:hypothetical protein
MRGLSAQGWTYRAGWVLTAVHPAFVGFDAGTTFTAWGSLTGLALLGAHLAAKDRGGRDADGAPTRAAG